MKPQIRHWTSESVLLNAAFKFCFLKIQFSFFFKVGLVHQKATSHINNSVKHHWEKET